MKVASRRLTAFLLVFAAASCGWACTTILGDFDVQMPEDDGGGDGGVRETGASDSAAPRVDAAFSASDSGPDGAGLVDTTSGDEHPGGDSASPPIPVGDGEAGIADGGATGVMQGSDGAAHSAGGEGGLDVTNVEGGSDPEVDAPMDAEDGDAGLCTPNATKCYSNGVATCDSDGQWSSPVGCSLDAPVCANGSCLAPSQDGDTATPISCLPGGPGLANCGPGGNGIESCCTSLAVAGGAFYRTYINAGGGPGNEGDLAYVSGFRLDKYEVTVGRFRQFVNAWNGGAGYLPTAGSGKHAHLNSGLGLVDVGVDAGVAYEAGWVEADDSNIAPTNANLACNPVYATWTPSAGNNENRPINCVNWSEAYAFCIWDGGFLPSQTEWEYTAAAGSQQREYPWGTADPGTSNQYAIYGCDYPSGTGTCTGVVNIASVGTPMQGAGLWGQLDLAGSVYEWNLDWSAALVDPCTDCAYLTGDLARELGSGGQFNAPASSMHPSNRASEAPASRIDETGLRCARTP